MTTRRTGQRASTRASGAARRRKSSGRHSRKKSYKAQWFSVTALAVLGTVMVVHPDAGRQSLAASFAEQQDAVAQPPVQPVVVPTHLPSAVPTLTKPQRPAPTLTRAPKGSKPNVTVSSGKLSVVPGFAKATRSIGKITYRIEIEQGLSLNAAAVATAVHRTLTDPRGWQALQPVSFERTDRLDSDLRIIFATPTLTDKLCLPLETGGEVSCRVEDRVVLNAKRWVYAVPDYNGDVDLYRNYLVNHEVGHALGHGHSDCDQPNTPAPVMMQQTKGLGGCLPNAWPTTKAT